MEGIRLAVLRSLVLGLLAAGVVGFLPGGVRAQGAGDLVRTTKGSSVGVEVVGMTPLGVTISEGNQGTREIPLSEIRAVIFSGEPAELTRARVYVQNGGYRDAQDLLEKVNPAGIEKDFIKQEVEFYAAYSAAKLSLAGVGSIGETGQNLYRFVAEHPQSFHRLAAAELLGDLLVAAGNYPRARQQYAELAEAPWPEYKARAAILAGRALQAEGKHAEAVGQFDAAMQTAGTGEEAAAMRLSATLGRAVSLAETGELDQAVSTIQSVIRDADPEDAELHARAYNALGACYEKGGRQKEALLAYLHVDVLYSKVPAAHAEALRRLIPLWEAMGETEEVRKARQTLTEEYSSRP